MNKRIVYNSTTNNDEGGQIWAIRMKMKENYLFRIRNSEMDANSGLRITYNQ